MTSLMYAGICSRNSGRAWSSLVVLPCLALAFATGCGAEGAGEPTSPTATVGAALSVESDAEKQELVLTVVAQFVPHAESFWRESDLQEPRTGYYRATGSGVTQPRGAGNIAFAYATLLAAHPHQDSFAGVSRETLIDHTIQSIRHEAYTNVLSSAGYNRWGNGTWQASLETYLWAFAAHRFWDELDDDTRAVVRRVVVGEANLLINKPIASGEEGDTGAEDNAWNAPTPALAAVMFPEEPNAGQWRETAIRLALNASSTAEDASSSRLVDGRPLSDWMASVNLHPDLTLENHGFFNPIYQQVTHVNIGDAAIVYGEANIPLPEAFDFRTETIWEEILMRLAADDGDLIMPAGQDWTSKDYQHLAYLSILATRFQRVDASELESRALKLVARRQAAAGGGSLLGQADIGYETMLVKRLASMWWDHHLFGPSPTPNEEEYGQARQAAAGVKVFRYSDFIAARLGRAFVSMSWDPARPMGLVVPQAEGAPEDPIFSYYAPLNLLGSAAGIVGPHNCDCGENEFSTAGTIGERRFSMSAFADGTTILLDQGVGSTFTYSLESIPGVTGERPIWSAAGAGVGDLPGDWINAADRLAMIVRGGAGLRAETVSGSNSRLVLTGSVDTGSGNRGAVVLPLADHEQTEDLAPLVEQPNVPSDWSGLSARAADGSVRLALARWGGPAMASVELSDERGAPVPEEYGTLEGSTAEFTVRLAPTSSHGQTFRFFVQSTGVLRGQQDGENAAMLRNPTTQSTRVRVTYMPPSGKAKRIERKVAGGEEVRVSLAGGNLIFGGPELEPLVVARDELIALLESLDCGCEKDCSHHDSDHGCSHHESGRGCSHHDCKQDHCSHQWGKSLEIAVERALAAIDDAIERAERGEQEWDGAFSHAQRMVDALESEATRPWVSSEVRDAVLEVTERVTGLLDEAQSLGNEVKVWVEPVGLTQPGELTNLRVVSRNESDRLISGGSLTIKGPEGWATLGPLSAFRRLAPGDSAISEVTLPTPPTVAPGTVVMVTTELTYRAGRSDSVEWGEAMLTVDPALEWAPVSSQVPLADGGINEAAFQVVSYIDHPLELTLSVASPDGAIASMGEPSLVLGANGTAEVPVMLTGDDRTDGTGVLTLTAATSSGLIATADTELVFTRDMAFNPFGAPWPLIEASSSQPNYPPTLATDGNDSTFWVSSGTQSGQGPTPSHPETLTVDFGGQTEVGSVVMVPRPNYGPTAYTIEVSTDGTSWQQVAEKPNAPNATVTTSFPPATAQYVRLVFTGSWDWVQPPRNVQVATLSILPPSNDLALNPWGAPWPQAMASSAQSGYPATRAFDGDDGTFWVSGGTAAGQGPSVDHPEMLGVDFGRLLEVGSVTMVPRSGYGPSAYTIEVSSDGVSWQEVASVPSAANGTTITTTFPAVITRLIRLRITDSWDWVRPPRNVQIRTMIVEAP